MSFYIYQLKLIDKYYVPSLQVRYPYSRFHFTCMGICWKLISLIYRCHSCWVVNCDNGTMYTEDGVSQEH